MLIVFEQPTTIHTDSYAGEPPQIWLVAKAYRAATLCLFGIKRVLHYFLSIPFLGIRALSVASIQGSTFDHFALKALKPGLQAPFPTLL